jgi:type I restriction enzyme, S subunit
MALGEIATFRRGTAITAKQTVQGTIPVVANSPEPVYSHCESNRHGETIVVARSGANAGYVSYWNEPIFLTDAFSIDPDPTMMRPKFAFYLLKHSEHEIQGSKKGSGVPHIQIKAMHSMQFPVPALQEQDRIVTILDKFDALVNDLSTGLPAEINARRRQYEHYRDRLLTFAEAA